MLDHLSDEELVAKLKYENLSVRERILVERLEDIVCDNSQCEACLGWQHQNSELKSKIVELEEMVGELESEIKEIKQVTT